ncbi:hypothetical protein KIL84_012073 [Mauremys mutica]|uniref:Uncharacterized protein n=1 Tax=Mauremys mutica TaxID=74926 RepID=A0A9D3XET8_9SAUR|nr:hypothetical protein KIL84_012073 [Mauremys mutica]
MSAPPAAPPAKRWRLELRDPPSGKGKTLAVGLGAQAALRQQALVACGDSTQKTPLDSKYAQYTNGVNRLLIADVVAKWNVTYDMLGHVLENEWDLILLMSQ